MASNAPMTTSPRTRCIQPPSSQPSLISNMPQPGVPPADCLFGYDPVELIDDDGLVPALGNSVLIVTYTDSIDAPMRDLMQIVFGKVTGDPECNPNYPYMLKDIQVTAEATGPLRAEFGVEEGTPGLASTVQISNNGGHHTQTEIITIEVIEE